MKITVKKVKDTHGQGAFILLDGFDELPEDKRKDESFFMELLTGKILPKGRHNVRVVIV